jgi:thioredoxin 1
MISRRTALALAAGLSLTLVSPALATEKFTFEAFEAAQKAGKPILIDVFAAWCPTCKAQAPIIEGLAKNEKFKDFVFLKIDFDQQKDDLRKLNARNQSTLIVFKGEKEVGRSVGDTKPESVEEMLTKAL